MRHTPLLGFIDAFFSIASITLRFSSATSRTQSVFPVATRTCVLHPFTYPYNLSSSFILNPFGYLTTHELQSWSQSSPSTAGSTFGNKDSQGVFSAGVPGAGVEAPEIVCRAVSRKDLNAEAIFLEFSFGTFLAAVLYSMVKAGANWWAGGVLMP